MWWLKANLPSLLPGSGDVADPTSSDDVYVTDFSSRELSGQELDVLAPGSWVRGPFPGTPGYNHLPWWSKGIGDLVGRNSGNFFYVGGTSMATPHVSSLAALILQKNPTLKQSAVQSILKNNTLPLPPAGSRLVFDFDHFATITWDTNCDGVPCDAVGSGLIQADLAIAATPAVP
jgi:subtilisin family serine protease